MAKAIEKLASGGSRSVPINSLGGFEDVRRPECHQEQSSGHLKVVQDGNSAMARALGVNPGIKLEFTGDMNSIDIKKINKTMISGKHRKQQGICVAQHVWPHDVVSRAS